jgi:hypothetical protein
MPLIAAAVPDLPGLEIEKVKIDNINNASLYHWFFYQFDSDL